jgi:DNA mismatch repair protein MutL
VDRPIRRLPEIVIGRVAAGEVVERPSAVVKELVENSIDAGAMEIRVDFRRAGKDFISVEDNGIAMSKENAVLAMERHATSKISSFEDIYTINSFGFRGEALPSIGSVSRLTLRTKREMDELGTEIVVDDGKMISQRPCAMAEGTSIRVEHLFQSVPARRKFLKTDQTEANHIVEVMRLFALAFPAITFHLNRDGRKVFSAAAGNRLNRIGQLWGNEMADGLRQFDFAEDGIHCHGFLPNQQTQRELAKGEMVFFVNGRWIRSSDLRDWVQEAASRFFHRTATFSCFLFLEMPPALVDVNVHPTKKEVRFSRRGQLREILLRGLGEYFTQFSMPIYRCHVAATNLQGPVDVPQPKPISISRSSEKYSGPTVNFADSTAEVAGEEEIPIPQSEEMPEQSGGENFSQMPWRYIAMFDRTRAIFHSGNGLIIFDLRAATVAIAKEKLLREIANGESHRQKLLVPISIDLRNLDSDDLEGKLERLAAVGFSICRSGPGKFAISEIPAWIDGRSGEVFIYDWITAQLEVATPWHRTMAAIAAKRTASERLPAGEAEVASLLSAALGSAIDTSTICFEISAAEMDRRLRPATSS